MKKLFCLLAAIVLAFPPASVKADTLAFDSSSGPTATNPGTSVSHNHNITSGSNRVLYVGLLSNSNNINSATFDGANLTQIAQHQGGLDSRYLTLYCMVAPPVGTHSVSVSAATSQLLQIFSVSYQGAKQSCAPDAITSGNSAGNVNTFSLTLTTVTDNSFTLAMFRSGNATVSAGNGTTLKVASGYTGLFSSSQAVTPTGSNTLTANQSGSPTGMYGLMITVSPAPIAVPTWSIQSVDEMKYSKDVVCSQPSTTFIDQETSKAVELGANYIAVSGYYNNPACGNANTLLSNWVTSARSHNLKVWFRMKDLAFEGDYGVAKTTSPDGMRHQKLMVDWIAANSSLIQTGDIFTPNAEPQNGGINGITYCGSPANCQFTGKADFNLWLRQTHTMADLAIKAAGKTGVKIGYYGFDGFIAAGLGNPDSQGQSQLEPATIALMGNVAIDHYPETIGHTLAQDMPYIKQAIGSTTPIVISEYGTITTSNQTTAANQVSAFMTTAAAEPNVIGFNYWHMGPGGNEALINSDFTNRPSFTVVQDFYK